MNRSFIPGIEVEGTYEGVLCAMWQPDEDGRLRRNAEIAARSPEVPLPPSKARLEAHVAHLDRQADMEQWLWSAEYDAKSESAFEDGSRLHGQSLDALPALGLVSVLSTGTGIELSSRAFHALRVNAAREAVVQTAGAFRAGGPDARMAKLRQATGYAARCHGASRKGHRPDEVRMVTLTYRPAVDWSANHVKEYLRRVRLWHARRGIQCRYVWVAEIQDGKRRSDRKGRGVPHYHVLFWVPVGTPHMPKADDKGWWPHGSTRTELARGAVQYLMSYLKKGDSKNFDQFPKGCRLYGVGGLEHSMRRARRWLGLPGFVQGNSSAYDDWRRAPVGTGGGWIDPQGEHWPSEFRRVVCAGIQCLQRIHTHPRVIEASGPFAWITDREVILTKYTKH